MICRSLKTILLFGPTGSIGRNLISVCAEEEIRVIAVSHRESKRTAFLPEENAYFRLIQKDLSELRPEDIGEPVDGVFYLSWRGTSGEGRNDAVLQDANIKDLLSALDFSKACGARVFVGAGSQAEYGILEKRITETIEDLPGKDEIIIPLTAYGRAKREACFLGKKKAETLSVDFIWPRIFSVYGPTDRKGSLVMSLIDGLFKGECIPLTEGTQKWNYLYETDCARAMLLLMKSGRNGEIYHVASKDTRVLRDFIEEIKDIMKSDTELRFGTAETKGKLVTLDPSIEKLVRDTGFIERVSFREGIGKILEKSEEA